MPTRLYLPVSGAPPVDPPVGTGWTIPSTGNPPYRTTCGTAKTNTALTDYAVTGTTNVAVQHVLCRQFVTPPLAAQTISGTLSGVVRGLESNAGLNATIAVCVRRVNGTTGTHISDLIAVTASDATTTPPEFGTAAATRRLQDAAEATAIPITSTAVSAGDRLVIEIGFRKNNTTASRSCTLRFGDAAATDFALSDGLTTDLNPWVEFSGTVTFQQASSGSASVTGGGAVAATVAKGAGASATVAGGGTVTATGTAEQSGAHSGSAAISAAGTIAGSGTRGARASVSVTASATVTVTGARAARGSASVAAGGGVTVTSARGATGTAALAGVGLVASTGRRGALVTAVVSGGGAVTAGATDQVPEWSTPVRQRRGRRRTVRIGRRRR